MELIRSVILAVILCIPQVAAADCVQGDCANGHGIAVLPDGSRYEGEFRYGVRSGSGSMTYPDGTMYEGQWADDLPNGHGVKILADGMQYAGDFKNGLMYGSGMIVMPDGSQVKIQWQSDPALGKEKKQQEEAISTNGTEKEQGMLPALEEAQGQPGLESQKPVRHMEVSLEESGVSADEILQQESGVPAETAAHVDPQVAEKMAVATEKLNQAVKVNEIQIVETGRETSAAAQTTPLQELDVPAETAEHVSNQVPEKMEVAAEAQVQTETRKEIRVTEAEQVASVAAITSSEEDGSDERGGYEFYTEITSGVNYARITKGKGANIRAGASLTSEVLRTVQQDYPVAVLEQKGDWFLVEDFRTRKGWVYAPLLTDPGSVIIKVYKGNLRSGPGLTEDVIVQLDHGTVMTVEKTRGEWLQVSNSEDLNGWLHRQVIWP